MIEASPEPKPVLLSAIPIQSVATIQRLNPLLSPLLVMSTMGNKTLNSGLQNVSPNDFGEPIFYINSDPKAGEPQPKRSLTEGNSHGKDFHEFISVRVLLP
jgi:hypothetical protein